MSRIALTVLMLASLSACGRGGPVDSFCLAAKPIYFAAADRLTERTERAIIAHNEKFESLCMR